LDERRLERRLALARASLFERIGFALASGQSALKRIFALQNRLTTDTGLVHEALARLLGSAFRVRSVLR
jgi:hypothetical protein